MGRLRNPETAGAATSQASPVPAADTADDRSNRQMEDQ